MLGIECRTTRAHTLTAQNDATVPWETIELVVFDFDGVMTDNTVLVTADGTEYVRCWRSDGIGLAALRRIGVDALVLSTETDPVVSTRCAKLGIACKQGLDDKATALVDAAAERAVDLSRVAYVGNDVNDLGCLELVGLPIVVADAHPDVADAARYVTRASGGRGAVREVCDRITSARVADDAPK
jgi:YrbI family 3-deoxy-D-manno-octulosonate 8-phosphate phosphatase